jgi:hypothetical protein
MNRFFEHYRVRRLLYEYVRDETSPAEGDLVGRHILRCSRCAGEVEELRKGFRCFPTTGINPAREQPAEFWQHFLNEVDRRIDIPGVTKTNTFQEEWDSLLSWFVTRQRWVVGFSGAVAAIVITLLVMNPFNPPKNVSRQQEVAATRQAGPDIIQVNARAGDYFRKSQALFVGISNMKLENDHQVDLSAEQQLSRQLVHEARFLKQQPLDMRSARVVNDVEKILIQLANVRENQELPNVQIIRTGIHRENLLFKLRMAESMYNSLDVASQNIMTERK